MFCCNVCIFIYFVIYFICIQQLCFLKVKIVENNIKVYCIINDYFLIKRVGSVLDVCVDVLLEVFVKYSFYFDWVVVYIGQLLNLINIISIFKVYKELIIVEYF